MTPNTILDYTPHGPFFKYTFHSRVLFTFRGHEVAEGACYEAKYDQDMKGSRVFFGDREELQAEVITQTFDICQPSIVCTAGQAE